MKPKYFQIRLDRFCSYCSKKYLTSIIVPIISSLIIVELVGIRLRSRSELLFDPILRKPESANPIRLVDPLVHDLRKLRIQLRDHVGLVSGLPRLGRHREVDQICGRQRLGVDLKFTGLVNQLKFKSL